MTPTAEAGTPSLETNVDLIRAELFTAVLGDVMDAMGLRSQFLPPPRSAGSCLENPSWAGP